MDPASLVSGLMSAQMGQVQLAVAAKMLKINAEQGQDIAKLLDAAQANANRLANVAAGIGTNLDITA